MCASYPPRGEPASPSPLRARRGIIHALRSGGVARTPRPGDLFRGTPAKERSVKKPRPIAPASGKLAVLLPGLGAVGTTLIAGVEAVRRGLAKPIGSLTQMGTVRLGKRTERRAPLIKDFVPLASLDDVRFGAWDVFPDDAYESAMPRPRPGAGAPRAAQGAALGGEGDVRRLLARLREAARRPEREARRETSSSSASSSARTSAGFMQRARLRAGGDGLVRVDRGVPSAVGGARAARCGSRRRWPRTIRRSRPR